MDDENKGMDDENKGMAALGMIQDQMTTSFKNHCLPAVFWTL
jgi:hypothetical protein